jgi:hypothetical protein
MPKFKPARRGPKKSAVPQAGLPCVILVILGMVMVMLFMYFVMKSSAPD